MVQKMWAIQLSFEDFFEEFTKRELIENYVLFVKHFELTWKS